MFSLADTKCLSEMPDDSFDAVLAIGLFRYLNRETQKQCYEDIHRILKPAGKFLVVHQNLLFEAFALNEGTLRFWADFIEGYSDAPKLLGGKNVINALNEKIKVPKREYNPHSISRHMDVQSENPLTYHEVAERFGFKLEKILYPCSHLMPPFLEKQVDQKALNDVKRKMELEHTEDWRAMFVEYEFLAMLEKV
jgi:SAM-dependent methyltransferase